MNLQILTLTFKYSDEGTIHLYNVLRETKWHCIFNKCMVIFISNLVIKASKIKLVQFGQK